MINVLRIILIVFTERNFDFRTLTLSFRIISEKINKTLNLIGQFSWTRLACKTYVSECPWYV